MKTLFSFRFRITNNIFLFLLVLSGMTSPAFMSRANRDNSSTYKTNSQGLLNPDGTLNLGTNFHGMLDLKGINVVLDKQRGPLLYRVGANSASVQVSNNDWTGLNTGANNNVYAIAVAGDTVYIGGAFTSVGDCTGDAGGCHFIAKWNGSYWSGLNGGMDNNVTALAMVGNDLYAGGYFTRAGTCSSLTGCNHIAKWDGITWSPLGNGIINTNNSTNGHVFAIAANGNTVYVGGDFYYLQDCSGNCTAIAKWDGASWSEVGGGMNLGPHYLSLVNTIAIDGNDIYAGGYFFSAGTCVSGCNHIAKWDGSTWSPLGTGVGAVNFGVQTIAINGNDIYVGGDFGTAGNCLTGCDGIAKWDGAAWSSLGSGLNFGNVQAIAINGNEVFAGGFFNHIGTCSIGCDSIARWNGNTWMPLSTGVLHDYGSIFSLGISNNMIYAGGFFPSAGACTEDCKDIAQYPLVGGFNIYLPIIYK